MWHLPRGTLLKQRAPLVLILIVSACLAARLGVGGASGEGSPALANPGEAVVTQESNYSDDFSAPGYLDEYQASVGSGSHRFQSEKNSIPLANGALRTLVRDQQNGIAGPGRFRCLETVFA